MREQQTWTHRRRAQPHPTRYMNAYANLHAQNLEPEEENAALGAAGSRNHSRQRPTPDTGEQPAPPMPFPQKQAKERSLAVDARTCLEGPPDLRHRFSSTGVV